MRTLLITSLFLLAVVFACSAQSTVAFAASHAPSRCELVYFGTRGRAEWLRLALEMQGTPYAERAVTSTEWRGEAGFKAAGEADGRLAFGQLPLLTCVWSGDAEGAVRAHAAHLVQTAAAVRWLASRQGSNLHLAAASEDETFAVDQLLGAYEDVRSRYGALIYNPEYAARRDTYFGSTLPEWLARLERYKATRYSRRAEVVAAAIAGTWATTGEPYRAHALGDTPVEELEPLEDAAWVRNGQVTIADLAMFDLLNVHVQLEPDCLALFPRLGAFHRAFAAHPRIAAYLVSHRRPRWQNGPSAYADNEATAPAQEREL